MSQPTATGDAVSMTLHALQAVDDASLVQLTRLDLGEIQALKQEVAEIFPSSNLPAFLLQGLVQLDARVLPRERVKHDLGLLAQAGQLIARGVYGAFLATPAVALIAYQKLLALAGKDLTSAFPEGAWQFYTQFAMREDQARHANETIGFQLAHQAARPDLAAAAWAVAATRAIWDYDDLLRNEWQERVLLGCVDAALAEAAAAEPAIAALAEDQRALATEQRARALRTHYGLERLASGWAQRRSYRRSGATPYPRERRQLFFAYMDAALAALPAPLRDAAWSRFRAQAERLARYQDQMHILASLEPSANEDQRAPLTLAEAHIALVANGRYYLLPLVACAADGTPLIFPPDAGPEMPGAPLPLSRGDSGILRDRYRNPVAIDRSGAVRVGSRTQPIGVLRPPAPVETAALVSAALAHAAAQPPLTGEQADLLLMVAPRARFPKLQKQLDEPISGAVAQLCRAPLIINWDRHNGALPLGAIRHTRRGVGASALTIIRTDRSTVFDQSHIFFDAMWGMAFSEILTNEAIATYAELATLPPAQHPAPAPLDLSAPPALLSALSATAGPVEANAESDLADLGRINLLRKRLAQRGLSLTVNDLLLLARCGHALGYAPGQRAAQALASLDRDLAATVRQALEAGRDVNPALLVPMDASAVDPRERLFPVCVRSPFTGLLPLIAECWEHYKVVQREPNPDAAGELVARRQKLYADLAGYGEYLLALKAVAMRGESFNSAAIRLLAHLPSHMQKVIDLIPQKIGILNEILKGREVFSNVGQMARGSSLSRFTSARDDGDTKLLIWGVMADTNSRLRISLRDFRPHVVALHDAGRADLAALLAQDYVDTYAYSINVLVARLHSLVTYTPG